MNKGNLILALFTAMVSIISCAENETNPTKKEKKPPTQEELFDMNRRLMNEEKTRIGHFIKRKRWPVQNSGTGLKYWIYEETSGDTISQKDLVKVRYVITLMTGDTCYNRWNNPEEFTVDYDQVESGLHEGIKYMRKGERAKLILPPHLAHGLVGDMNKIPMNATLIYDIQVLDE